MFCLQTILILKRTRNKLFTFLLILIIEIIFCKNASEVRKNIILKIKQTSGSVRVIIKHCKYASLINTSAEQEIKGTRKIDLFNKIYVT